MRDFSAQIDAVSSGACLGLMPEIADSDRDLRVK
jgi:hypothetical protein